MTKAEVKKRHHALRQLRDKLCIEAEETETKVNKMQKEVGLKEGIITSINAVLDGLEELM